MGSLKEAALGMFVATALFAGITTLATGCGSQGAASPPRSSGPEATAVAVEAGQAKEQRIELAEAAVRNGRYELPDTGAFQLKDGSYQEKYGEGASQVKRVGVVTVAFGDIDGDKVEDAAVVLWVNTGGSGTFIYLVPVLNKDGKGQQAGAQLLGDRVQIKSLTIASGKIRLEVLGQGSGDPMVGPSLLWEQEYALQGGRLARLTPAGPTATPASKSAAQAGSSDLAGTIWMWERFASSAEKGSFPVVYPPAYRLELLPDGKYSFQADCNSGQGSYTLEGSHLVLSPGPITLAECRPGSQYSQFVRMLGEVATYVLKGDTLHLNLKMDGGDMVFSKLSAVTGRLVGPEGDTAPADSSAEIMIVDKAGTAIGGVITKAQLPMQFEARYKPANIDPSAAYSLEVTIKDAQKNVVFRSSRPLPVVTRGNPSYHLEVAVERVR